MNKKIKSIASIKEALDVLSSAAQEQKEEVLDVIEKDYHSLKDTFLDLKPKFGQHLQEVKGRAQDEYKRREEAFTKASQELRGDIEKHVREEPLRSIVWTALGAFVIGLIFGSRK